jgi:sugar phosphate permease
MTAIAAGAFTVAKQWTRPIGGIGAGFLGDKFPKEKIIIITYFLASLGFLCLVNFPQLDSRTFLFCMITLIGMLTYSIRGLYWALLDSCHLPLRLTGLAIGLVSLIGYLPDVILPMINSAIFNRYPGAASYKIYFTYIAVCGFLGALLTAYFQKITKNGKRLEAE